MLDMKTLLNECYELVRYNLEKANIKYSKKYAEGACTITGNGNQLKQVAVNLLNNARDAMRGGGELTVTCRTEGNKVVVEISDNGPGVPDKIRNTIFAPFFTTKEEGKGTGLGLSISKDIMTEHNGTIDFKNRDGGGTVFMLVLPRKKEP